MYMSMLQGSVGVLQVVWTAVQLRPLPGGHQRAAVPLLPWQRSFFLG